MNKKVTKGTIRGLDRINTVHGIFIVILLKNYGKKNIKQKYIKMKK